MHWQHIFEARACQASGATTCAGGQVTQAAIALAKLCFEHSDGKNGVKAKLSPESMGRTLGTPDCEKQSEKPTQVNYVD